MGLFDKMFSGAAKAQLANQQEAAFSVIYASMAADGTIDDEEINSLSHVLLQKKTFKGLNIREVYMKIAKMHTSVGAGELLGAASELIPAEKKAGVFAVAVDMMLADGIVGIKEKATLEQIQSCLAISDEQASMIVEVTLLKNNL